MPVADCEWTRVAMRVNRLRQMRTQASAITIENNSQLNTHGSKPVMVEPMYSAGSVAVLGQDRLRHALVLRGHGGLDVVFVPHAARAQAQLVTQLRQCVSK